MVEDAFACCANPVKNAMLETSMIFCKAKNSIALLKPYSYLQAPGFIEAAEIESWKMRRCPASLLRISIIL